MVKIAVNGCCGKMGKRIISLAAADPDMKLVGALERSEHPDLGKQIEGVTISTAPSCIEKADVVIDFTAAASTIKLLGALKKYKKAAVIGTTGLTQDDIDKIYKTAETLPILFSPNMSKGVNILFRQVGQLARSLKGYKVKIKEAHHIHKKDAPSGTAKKIAQIIEENSGVKVEDIQSIREDEIVGDHEVTFVSGLDVITISHSAKTRDILAQGAVDAAKWLAKKTIGLYSMQDVLGK